MATVVDGAGMTADIPGPPGTLLFENDLVRVWELIMEPGDYCLWHNHPYDHLLVLQDGCKLEAWDSNGQTSTFEFEDNQAFFMPKGSHTETVRNLSEDRTLRELIIDLKTSLPDEQVFGFFNYFRPGTPTTALKTPTF